MWENKRFFTTNTTIIWLIISRSSHCGAQRARSYAIAYLLTGAQHTLRAGIGRVDRELFHQIIVHRNRKIWIILSTHWVLQCSSKSYIKNFFATSFIATSFALSCSPMAFDGSLTYFVAYTSGGHRWAFAVKNISASSGGFLMKTFDADPWPLVIDTDTKTPTFKRSRSVEASRNWPSFKFLKARLEFFTLSVVDIGPDVCKMAVMISLIPTGCWWSGIRFCTVTTGQIKSKFGLVGLHNNTSACMRTCVQLFFM